MIASSRLSSEKGFTLIEVMIAITILAFITLFTTQSIRQALRQKSKMSYDIERISLVRDALKVMERDINMAFNYRDPSIQIYNDAQTERKNRKNKPKTNTNPNGGASPTPAPAPIPAPTSAATGGGGEDEFALKEEVILTQFIGKKESLHFTSRSFVRTQRDSQVGDQAEIGYFLKKCKSRANLKNTSNCLWRRVNPYIDKDIESGGDETALIENVVVFEMKYLGPGKEEWASEWSSAEGADDVTRHNFPFAVEITLEMKPESKTKKFKATRMTMVASIRNPNNQKEKKEDPATEAPPAPNPNGGAGP